MKAGVLKASTGVIPALSSNELFAENASLVKKVRETRNATATPPMAVPEKKGQQDTSSIHSPLEIGSTHVSAIAFDLALYADRGEPLVW